MGDILYTSIRIMVVLQYVCIVTLTPIKSKFAILVCLTHHHGKKTRLGNLRSTVKDYPEGRLGCDPGHWPEAVSSPVTARHVPPVVPDRGASGQQHPREQDTDAEPSGATHGRRGGWRRKVQVMTMVICWYLAEYCFNLTLF